MSDKYDKLDDFWDISKLTPKKSNKLSPFSQNEKTTEFYIDGQAPSSSEEGKLTFPGMSSEASGAGSDISYEPKTRGFIKSVKIIHSRDRYDFYDSFRKAALIYFDFKTAKCEFAPFYSYMPQYSQLNSAQKNYYFYWRSEVRRGRYIKTDYSYIYLFVYEILNLPDKITPEDGLMLLCRLWREYRADLPRIDDFMAVWVQDYCLVYNLECPVDLLRDFIFDVISAVSFKEFYLSGVDGKDPDGVAAMTAYLSDYDWHKGKYATSEHGEEYKRHMEGALGTLIAYLWNNGEMLRSDTAPMKVRRDAFPKSLCTHSVKCKLEIEYYPLCTSDAMRRSFTAAVKYSENKLRAALGVKSRLAIKDLPTDYAAIIDNYFEDIIAAARYERLRAQAPEYEKLYDALEDELSHDSADEIERLSWGTTARLVEEELSEEDQAEAIFEPETPAPELAPNVPEQPLLEQDTSARYGLSDGEIDFITALLSGDGEALRSATDAVGESRDYIAERINEAFSESFGDIIIELIDDEYKIIEDYVEEISEWLSKITK